MAYPVPGYRGGLGRKRGHSNDNTPAHHNDNQAWFEDYPGQAEALGDNLAEALGDLADELDRQAKSPAKFKKGPLASAFLLGWEIGGVLDDHGFNLFRWRPGVPSAYDTTGWTICQLCNDGATHVRTISQAACVPHSCTGTFFGTTPRPIPIVPGIPRYGAAQQLVKRPVPTNPIYWKALDSMKLGVNQPYITAYSTVPVWQPVPRTRVRPKPEELPIVRPHPVPYAPPVPRTPDPATGGQPSLAPRTGDVTVFTYQPGRKPRVVVRPELRQRPKPRQKERKRKMNRGMAAILQLINWSTEALDVVEALADAIPDGPCKDRFKPKRTFQKGADGKWKYTGDNGFTIARLKMAAVYSCSAQIDIDTAIFNLIWTQIEDTIWATLGISSKNIGKEYGTTTGANRLLSEVYGDRYAGMTKAAKDWLVSRVNALLGVTVQG